MTFLLMLLSTCGCASFGSLFKSIFTVKAADTIQGVGTANVKVADKAEAKAEMNIGNTKTKIDNKTSVGGNQTNDSDLMKTIFQSNVELQKQLVRTQDKSDSRFMNLLYMFIGSLFTLIFRYELRISKLMNRMFDARDKEDEQDDKLINKTYEVKIKEENKV